MKTGECKLCLQKKKLVFSHIFPKFLYEPSFYDDKQRMLLVNHKDLLSEQKHKLTQREFIDGNILCQQCDNVILSKYEGYTKKLMFGGDPLFQAPEIKKDNHHRDFDVVQINGVDYNLYKCFLLSLIWRASISKLSYFNNIDLGDKHNEEIRRTLISGIPGEETKYMILLISYRATNQGLNDIITTGISSRLITGGRVITLLIGGIIYRFAIGSSQQEFNKLFYFSTPKKTNAFNILSFKSAQSLEIALKLSGILN
jgi:hypothetical protein